MRCFFPGCDNGGGARFKGLYSSGGGDSGGGGGNNGGGGNQTPVASDYTIGNLNQTAGSVTAVTITPKSGKSTGAVTIKYNGSTTIPQTAATYAVTFDVAAVTGWNAATGLSAGNLVVTPAFNFEYEIGDTGPGGGKIFYVSATGFTMTDDGSTAHYLEAAPADMATHLAWASSIYTDIPGTATGIGTGRKNTALILAIEANAPAAKACDDYTNNGKTDWFLPSKDELNQLYENRNAVGNLNTSKGIYWSSSQYNYSSQDDVSCPWCQFFFSGDHFNIYYNTDTYSVRAVRVF